MTDNVTYIRQDMNPDHVLDSAKGLEHVVVLGYREGEFEAFASGGLSDAECLLMAELFKRIILEAHE